ncbi:hypothetical protein [Micromonospora sp. NBS 11-29]|uniref:hypothetical protein n=1 Tax=Micromonospora sp. NBS 11-29 TaxID=1960879 RepID=UPI0020CFDEB0|nr:hypothetical protein [Micromonospora sp. NBS 11-29]
MAVEVGRASPRRVRRLRAGTGAFATAPGIAGTAVTVAVLGVTAIGVRHAPRHNRLAERALPPATAASTPPARALHV